MQLRLVEARTLGTGPATDALDLLGVSLEELEGKTPIETFEFLRQKLSEVEDSSERLFLADELLGGSSERLQRTLSLTAGEWANLRHEVAASGQVVSNEAVAAAVDAQVAYDELGAVLTTLAEDLARTWIPAVTEATVATTDFIVGASLLAERLADAGKEADGSGGFFDRFGDALAVTPFGDFVRGLRDVAELVTDVGEEARIADEAERALAEGADIATDAIDRQAAGVVTLTEGLRTLSGEIVAAASLMSAEEAAAIGIGGAGGAFRNPTADAAIRDLRSANAPRTPVSEGPSDREGALASATRESFRLSLAPLEDIARITADYDRRIAEANEEGWPDVAAELTNNKEVAIENYSAAEDTRLGEERNRLLMSAEGRLQSLRDEAAGLTASQIELRETNEAIRTAVEAGDTELAAVYRETGVLLGNKIDEEGAGDTILSKERNRLLMSAEGRLQSLRDEAADLTAAQIELRETNEAMREAIEAGDTELAEVYRETGVLLGNKIAEEAEAGRDSAEGDTSRTVAAIDRVGARLLRGGSSDRLASLAFEGGGTDARRSAQLYRNYLDLAPDEGSLVNAVDFGNLDLAEQRRLGGSRSQSTGTADGRRERPDRGARLRRRCSGRHDAQHRSGRSVTPPVRW